MLVLIVLYVMVTVCEFGVGLWSRNRRLARVESVAESNILGVVGEGDTQNDI